MRLRKDTDGYRYCFMAINANRKVESSMPYDVMNPEGGKTIFNFIVTILESAMRCSPTVTSKAAEQRDMEISNFMEKHGQRSMYRSLVTSDIVGRGGRNRGYATTETGGSI